MRLFAGLFGSHFQNRRRSKPSAAAGIVDTLETRVLLAAVNLADEEQLILELINRARANPEAEAARLGISLNASLPAGTISAAAKQPLAPNQQLQNAAVTHSTDMIDRDFFAHTNPGGVTPGGRATAAGYEWWTISENIAYLGYFGNVDINANSRQAHDLLFRSAGHRKNLLMPEVEEIGVGSRSGAFIPSGGNATLVTENFGRRDLNPIITGVVYSDTNNSDFYDIGEAIRGGTITARRVSDGVTFTETIGTSGGYALIVPAGSYVVTAAFTRNGSPVSMSSSVTASVDNVKVDFDATAAVTVNLTLSSPTVAMTETGAASTLQFAVTRAGSLTGALTVSLNSNDPSELSVPASVLIPDGQSSVNFTVTAVDDGLIDGIQTALVQASAVGAVAVNRSLRVADTTAPSFTVYDVVTTTLRPTFSWISISNAASYEILVVQITTASSVFHRQAGITSTSFAMPRDLPLGTFYIRLRAITSAGLYSPWGPIQMIRSRPVTSVEGSGRIETSGSFTIRWAAIPGATSYDIVVDRLTSQTRGFLRNGAVPTNSLAVSDFPIGQYHVRVRVQAPGMASGWSIAAVVSVSIQPTGVRVNAADIRSITTLTWDAVNGAVRYDVQVDNQTTGVSQVIRNVNVVGTSLAMPTLTTGSYTAVVRAIDSANRTHSTSAPCAFVFNGPTRLTLAEMTLAGRPLFSWIVVAGAVRYELVFANASLVPQITLSNLTGNQYQPAVPLAAGVWRAWIRAFDSSGNATAISNTVAFTLV